METVMGICGMGIRIRGIMSVHDIIKEEAQGATTSVRKGERILVAMQKKTSVKGLILRWQALTMGNRMPKMVTGKRELMNQTVRFQSFLSF